MSGADDALTSDEQLADTTERTSYSLVPIDAALLTDPQPVQSESGRVSGPSAVRDSSVGQRARSEEHGKERRGRRQGGRGGCERASAATGGIRRRSELQTIEHPGNQPGRDRGPEREQSIEKRHADRIGR